MLRTRPDERPWYRSGMTGVGDHEATAVEQVVADETVDELGDSSAEFGAASFELFERLGEPVCHLDPAPRKCPVELVLVVSEDAQRTAGSDHRHRQIEHLGDTGAPVDEVSQKDDAPALRVGDRFGPTSRSRVGRAVARARRGSRARRR